jgi:beta-hydroxylase
MKYFFEDKIKNLPICIDLIDNFDSIKTEILNFIKNPNSLNDYPQYKVGGGKWIYENYWKAAPLSRFEGEHIELNADEEMNKKVEYLINLGRKSCPTIISVINKMEQEGNLANCFISRLIPGSIINPHVGWSDKWLRVHLGIVTDPECKITIGNETQAWEDKKLLAFIDGPPNPHSVRHDGSKERVILSVDLKREFLRKALN